VIRSNLISGRCRGILRVTYSQLCQQFDNVRRYRNSLPRCPAYPSGDPFSLWELLYPFRRNVLKKKKKKKKKGKKKKKTKEEEEEEEEEEGVI